MNMSIASATAGAAAMSHSNAPSAIVIFFVMQILPFEDGLTLHALLLACWTPLAYPTSVLQVSPTQLVHCVTHVSGLDPVHRKSLFS
jgi:hypothetical protein